MAHQYYKILSLHSKKDFENNAANSLELKATVCKDKKGNVDYSKFTHLLQRCLDTDHLMVVCQNSKKKLRSIHPIKLSNGSFLGYSEAFINVKVTKASRESLYRNGFFYNNKKYVRYKRSTSSAKNSNCLFILDELKEIMDIWNNCGLDFSHGTSSSLTSWEAYTALTLSGIQDTFSIPKKSILLIKDLESSFMTSGIGVYLDATNHLASSPQDDIVIHNKIWDGECLIDESVFQELSHDFSDKHMLLLRNRFFKSCGFKTKLQKWFRDNNITNTEALNGYTLAENIEDIKIVITESSLKYLKFYQGDTKNVDYLKDALQAWFHGLGESDLLTFGIVKCDVPSRYSKGKMVQTNYQLLNTLGLNENESLELLTPTLEYIEKAKTDSDYFMRLLENNMAAPIAEEENEDAPEDDWSDLFDLSDTKLYNYKENTIKELLSLTKKAFHTQICKTVRNRLMNDLKETVACGRFLIPGTYATLFGNPIEFLVSIITKGYSLPTNPEPVCVKIGDAEVEYPTLVANEIYTTMFDDGSTLCGARSPHITMGNLFLCKNTYLNNETGNSFLRDYFDLSPQIVCVNSINHNLLQRLNGADFDSDIMLITNHPIIVNATKRQRDLFPVPVNCLAEDIAIGSNNTTDFSNINERTKLLIEIDNKIADNMIGQIVNASQLLNSILWTRFPNLCSTDIQKFHLRQQDKRSYSCDYIYNLICELEVLSNIEIDKAKRTYLENPATEYRRLLQYIQTYQVECVDGEYFIGNIPQYLVVIRNSKWVQKAPEVKDATPTAKWGDMYLHKTDNVIHHSTMSYIYSLTMEKLKDAPKIQVVPLSSLVNKVSGTRKNTDPFKKLKIVCAYYYLLIRTCYFITNNGSRTPDYGKCSNYVDSCYHAVEKIITSAENKEFIIYSLLRELDETSSSNNSFIVRNLAATINSWSNAKRYAKSDDLVKLVNKIEEDNKAKSKPKSKLPIDENYGDLLLSALLNAKDANGTHLLKEMIINTK